MNIKPEILNISTSIEVYANSESLSQNEKELLEKANEAVKNAYAPYSNFYVGAALLLENGIIVTGNNQENAAYPSGLCAERTAFFYASSQYPGIKIKSIAIAYQSKEIVAGDPITPCGACRQVIAEYENHFNSPIRIIMGGNNGKVYIAKSIESLLPLMFSRKNLK